MIVVIRRIRAMRLVWKWAPPIRLVRGDMARAPNPERKRSQPRVEGRGYRSRNQTSQIGADADPCQNDSDDARPGVEGDAHVRGHDPSCHQLNDQGAEARDENDDIGLDDLFSHTETPLNFLSLPRHKPGATEDCRGI